VEDDWDYARGKVLGPAIGLIVVCLVSLAALALALVFDVWLLGSGTAAQMPPRGGMRHEDVVKIRMLWALLMVVANVITLIGAVRMKGIRQLGFVRLACILGLLPCLGPCFVLGMPFGIWGLIVLNDPRVQEVFQA